MRNVKKCIVTVFAAIMLLSSTRIVQARTITCIPGDPHFEVTRVTHLWGNPFDENSVVPGSFQISGSLVGFAMPGLPVLGQSPVVNGHRLITIPLTGATGWINVNYLAVLSGVWDSC